MPCERNQVVTNTRILSRYLQLLGGDKDTTVPHLTLVESLHGILKTLNAHGVLVDEGLDLVAGGELQHAVVGGAVGDDGALNAEPGEEERHVGNDKVAGLDGEREDDGTRSEDGHVKRPVWELVSNWHF